MSTIQLEEPITAGGIQAVNFFNGRLLSAEDVTHEQANNLLGHRRLGRAAGAGVTFGLEVERNIAQSTATNPVLTVRSGLGVSAAGHTLWLQDDTDISMVRTDQVAVSGEVFGLCDAAIPGVSVTTDDVYLLTIGPAEVREGKAPVSGLGNVPAVCNSRYTTGGVRFRLVALQLSPTELADSQRLRNRVAYKMFGVDDPKLSAFLNNPYDIDLSSYGFLDQITGTSLTLCEVPIALVYWSATLGLQFIDLWGVRRSTFRPASNRWSLFVGERRRVEAEAIFLQFAEQLRDIRRSEKNLNQLVAADRFDYLPPAGILPLTGLAGASGFQWDSFFVGQAVHPPVFIEGAIVEPLIRTALDYSPISLVRRDPIRLFQVVDGVNTRPYLVFATAYIPFLGDARFDTSRWNFCNFA
jgi:hypothetical protein